MSISVTENRENRFNPLKWGVYGAGAGVVARSLMPITGEENERLSQIMAERRGVVKRKVDTFLHELRETANNAPDSERPGYDLYFEYSNSELDKTARPQIEQKTAALPEAAKKKFFEIKKHVDAMVAETKKAHDFIGRAVIKESRSLFNFVSVGALLAVGCAFVGHVLSKMADSSEPTLNNSPSLDKIA